MILIIWIFKKGISYKDALEIRKNHLGKGIVEINLT